MSKFVEIGGCIFNKDSIMAICPRVDEFGNHLLEIMLTNNSEIQLKFESEEEVDEEYNWAINLLKVEWLLDEDIDSQEFEN